MDNSEEDAGAATIASRRTSAREKELEAPEETLSNVGAVRDAHSVGIVGEEASDLDSMPSPGAPDANTSTEAILDMIDEFVDGPSALRPDSYLCSSVTLPELKLEAALKQPEPLPAQVALPSSPENVNQVNTHTDSQCENVESKQIPSISSQHKNNEIEVSIAPLHSESIVNSEAEPPSLPTQSENRPCEVPAAIPSVNINIQSEEPQPVPCQSKESSSVDCVVESLQASSSKSESEAAESRLPETPSQASIVFEEPSVCAQLLPSSSANQTVEITEDSACSERTVECAPTSDVIQRLTVESVESTSSDSNVSDSVNQCVFEGSKHSPLRRRLVRPTPSDRPPDCTVSSTVDSHINVNIVGQSDCVTKDVSSSSDAVPLVHGKVKPEEIRNISEVSVCQAETSVSPRKIKLVRPKSTVTRPVLDSIVKNEAETCLPSSSGTVPHNEIKPGKGSSDSILKKLIKNVPDQTPSSLIASLAEDNITPNVDNIEPSLQSSTMPVPVHNVEAETKPLKSIEESLKSGDYIPLSSDLSSKQIVSDSSKVSIRSEEEQTCLKELPATKVPPLKLNILRSNSPCSSTMEAGNESEISTLAMRVPPFKLSVPNKVQSPKKLVEEVQQSDVEMKVPPLKLSKLSELPTNFCTETEKRIPPLKLCTQASDTAKIITEEANCNETRKVPPIRISSAICESTCREMSEDASVEKKIPPLKISTHNAEVLKTQTDDKKIPSIKINTHTSEITTIEDTCNSRNQAVEKKDESEKKVPPIKLILAGTNCETSNVPQSAEVKDVGQSSECDSKVPKLTIKLGSKQSQPEEIKSPIPKLTIKPIKPSSEDKRTNSHEHIPPITKLNIKPISKPAEKINDVHRKSSSSEISESEYSENDESASTSDQASASSDQGMQEDMPKVTIKLGKPDLNENKPVEQNIPKLTIKGLQNCDNIDGESCSQLKIIVTESHQLEKVPKLTIKGLTKSDSPQLSPKLTIKPMKPPDNIPTLTDSEQSENQPIPKLRISTSEIANTSTKENTHFPKITIKPVTRSGPNSPAKVGKKISECESDFPVVTKLNIKPIIKPQDVENEELSEVPVVSKLNIKPIVKPNKEEESLTLSKTPEKIITKIYEESCAIIPVVTKINIKPIMKPESDDNCRDSENQSSETGNSSDDNTDVPIVTKLNIKPICNPTESEDKGFSEDNVPIITKLNIKPVVDPNESGSLSPKLDGRKITKLNIKPIVKPDEANEKKITEVPSKNPPLVMKINKRVVSDGEINHVDKEKEHVHNNIDILNEKQDILLEKHKVNCFLQDSTIKPDKHKEEQSKSSFEEHNTPASTCNMVVKSLASPNTGVKTRNMELVNTNTTPVINAISSFDATRTSVQNCTLLKKLLENKSDIMLDSKLNDNKQNVKTKTLPDKPVELNSVERTESPTILQGQNVHLNDIDQDVSWTKITDSCPVKSKLHSIQDKDVIENITKPLEINITERVASPSSGQDSPRIILKINKTDHGSSAQIITEESRRPDTPKIQEDNIDKDNETHHGKKVYNRRKQNMDITPSINLGKRLRSSKIVNTETPPPKRQYAGKRQPSSEISPPQNKQPELSVLEAKRLRLGQILSNKNLTVTKVSPPSPQGKPRIDLKQDPLTSNHSILNNENCSKNGNSKLHSILSNLAAKQIQAMPLNDIKCTEKNLIVASDFDANASTGSTTIEMVAIENSHIKVQEMMINENSDSRDCVILSAEEASRDPLEGESKLQATPETEIAVKQLETPTPRKRGRPRKLPVSEEAKPVTLPATALEERPQRSLRLSRDRPAIIAKPRGRGRGRGAKRHSTPPAEDSPADRANKFLEQTTPESKLEDLDPTSSRVKLPRMTEALDKSVCNTPLSSRAEFNPFSEVSDVKVSLPEVEEGLMRSPAGGRRGRGRGRGRGAGARTPATPHAPHTPRGRGRARGGGKGAQYMRETMGIYGRVCGPATTTVELFEEEAQMMEDSATPSKPSHLMDEDSQSSVKSSTNDSSKLKKSKFTELFDSNKVWMASDVKEYTWPPPEQTDVDHQVMMIQEQIALFLGVKSFKRRYPELKRRPILGEEKEYVQLKGVASEALCELGITAVDASEVLDIMLSDYPHKYEEYRQYQRVRLLAEAANEEAESKQERVDRVEMKVVDKPVETKQEPKVDPEKTRQDMALAAIASASEYNARLNSLRPPAVVDLQSLTVHRRRAPLPAPQLKLEPPGGYYPHALLPGQYQCWYRRYTPEQLRYFPLNTVLSAPPAPPSPVESSSESDDSSSSSGDDLPDPTPSKRKKLIKTKRSSQTDTPIKKEEEIKEEVELCRVCNLRLEANRKYTHERFLVCSGCNANLHPGCLELNADTIRKCREYSWQCAECKCCAACNERRDVDNMVFCDLCDRGFHVDCVGQPIAPQGRWHCVECAVCKSCGARDPSGPPSAQNTETGFSPSPAVNVPTEWHHQTKRGPGGHKVYSHSLCTPCARAYRIGRYCPLCDRSFIGPKGNLQLIICKLCDRQHHQDCVRQTLSKVKVLDYTCAECRRAGITSRAAAVRNAPRTIATLFMAKRRFNKYAHKQYMQSRQKKETETEMEMFDDDEVSDPLEVNAPDESLNDSGD